MQRIDIDLGNNVHYTVTKIPNECPYCHHYINPLLLSHNYLRTSLEIIFECPKLECNRAFIATYIDFNGMDYHFDHCNIGSLKDCLFSSEIENVSPSFIIIYKEANAAEQYNLTQICGVGYRKALEFLIKDYLIKNNPENEKSIKAKFLGECIKHDISNANIKKVAERAVWLGNDETHYTKEWENKNIDDSKKLIEITVRWIEMEEITKSLESSMPNRKRGL